MKNKKLLLMGALLIGILNLPACKPITMEQKQQDEQQKEANVEQYDDVQELDFETGYVKGQLKENLYIDAIVPTNIPETLGDYEIYKKQVDEGNTEEQYTDELAGLVDKYYGEDISITYVELQQNERGNVFYNGNSGYLELDKMDTTYFSRIATINDVFPEYGMDDDTWLFDDIINDFLKVMEPVIPDNMGEDYICVHWDENYKSYVKEKYGEDSAFEYLWDWEELNLQYAPMHTDFYFLRLYTTIDGVRLKTYTNPVTYAYFEGELVDEACQFIDWEMLSRPYMAPYEHYMDLCIDKNGKIIGFNLVDNYNIGEKLRENKIISSKDAVKMFYDSVKGMIINEETIIRYVNLNYMVVVDEADESKYRNAYIMPVWELQIYEEGNSEYRVAIYSAVDGTMLKSAY